MLCASVIVYVLLMCVRVDLFEIRTTTDGVTSMNLTSGVIRGSWMLTRRGRRFQAFRGIRYAQPPVGPLRFQPPQPIYQYLEPVDATQEGPACPMPVVEGYYIDEDCLRLNVYTPYHNTRKKLLPVIVFIHPGGFYSFSGRSDVFGPGYLLDRDLVLVTINYRLGSLGFLSTGDELAPGNNGFKDQVAALKWVQRNIASFGGDPNLVTIAGCSAGAISVMLHMVSPMSKGLFHRAISMSGSGIDKGPLLTHQLDLAIRQAQLVNCPYDSSRVLIDCLRTKSFREIADSLDGFFMFAYDPVLLWQPVVEPDCGQERFLSEQPLLSIRRGKIHAVPYIVSQTRNEFFWKAFTIVDNMTLLPQLDLYFDQIAPISFMLPQYNRRQAVAWLKETYLDGRQPINDTSTARGLGRLYGDSVIAFSVHRLANLMCRNSPEPVFYYEFDYIGNHSFYESPDTGAPIGVAHQDDLIYLFTITYRFPIIPLSSPDSLMVDKMTAIWYNFARFGDPNPQEDTPELQGLSWPRMTPAKREYLRISKTFSIHTRLFEGWFQIWDALYPISYQPVVHVAPKFPDFYSPGGEFNFLGNLFGKTTWFSVD